MLYTLPVITVFFGHAIIMILAYLLGAWLNGRKVNAGEVSHQRKPGTMIIEGTLLSFLLGFTFNAAFDKYVSRKNIFNEEINDISTVYSIASLYPDSLKKEFSISLDNYLGSRIAYYDEKENQDKIDFELKKTDSISKKIMLLFAKFAKDSNNIYPREMIPALNKLFDTSSTREMLDKARVPLPALKLLLLISILVSFLSGTNGSFSRNDWFTAIGFSLLVSMTLYLILDLDSSRMGQINLDDQQKRLIDFYHSTK